jgi:hypothetical protein
VFDISLEWGEKSWFGWAFLMVIGKELTLGRHSSCDVKFEDRLVSKCHCKIFRETDEHTSIVFLEDLRYSRRFFLPQTLVPMEHGSMATF